MSVYRYTGCDTEQQTLRGGAHAPAAVEGTEDQELTLVHFSA